MLELKRRISQTVKIGERCLVSVIDTERNPDGDYVTIRLREFRMSVNVVLQVGECCEAQVDGHKLYIHLRGVERGEALLGFDAPRELAIDRGEAA